MAKGGQTAAPDFLCVGLRRAGAGWLRRQLVDHPRFEIPDAGAASMLQTPEGIDQFLRSFGLAGARIRGDVDEAYGDLPLQVIADLAAAAPAMRVVLLLRDPVERLWAELCDAVARGEVAAEATEDALRAAAFLERAPRQLPGTEVYLRWASHFVVRLMPLRRLVNKPELARHSLVAWLGGGEEPPDLGVRYDGPDGAEPPIPPRIRRLLANQAAAELLEGAELLGPEGAKWAERHLPPGAAEDAATARARLPDPMRRVLDSVDGLPPRGVVAMRLLQRWREVEPLGEVIAMQALRNLLLGHSLPQTAGRSPPIGVQPGLRHEIGELAGRLQADLVERIEAPPAIPPRPAPERPARILVLMDHLPPADHMGAHLRQVCAYSAALAQSPGVEAVRVLVTQESAPEYIPFSNREVGPGELDGWRRELETVAGGPVPKVDFRIISRRGPVAPCADALEAALAFAPDLVLAFIGLYGSAILPPVLNRSVPVVAVQFGRISPEPPFGDLVLAQSHNDDFTDQPTPDKWRNHTLPVIPFARLSTLPPQAVGPASPLRLVTALAANRLERAIMMDDAAGAHFILDFLARHSAATWLLVGVDDPEALRRALADIAPPGCLDRVVILEPVKDLRAVFAHCQIYVHGPPLAGGAMGIAMAIAEGLPVLVRKGTDAGNFIDPDLLYRDASDAGRLLEAWATDEALRGRVLARQQKRLAEGNSLEAAGRTLAALIPEAAARFNARLGLG